MEEKKRRAASTTDGWPDRAPGVKATTMCISARAYTPREIIRATWAGNATCVILASLSSSRPSLWRKARSDCAAPRFRSDAHETCESNESGCEEQGRNERSWRKFDSRSLVPRRNARKSAVTPSNSNARKKRGEDPMETNNDGNSHLDSHSCVLLK